MTVSTATVTVRVELFGTPRIRTGRRQVELSIPQPANRGRLIAALVQECPALVGHGLKEDLTGLEDGFAFNLNGLTFPGESDFILAQGDSVLLISSQAGG